MPVEDLKTWNYDSAIPGTYQAYVYALKMKYGVAKRFVTLESSSRRLLSFLAANYKVKSAGYQEMTQTDRVSEELEYSHLVVLDSRLDVFYFNVLGSYPQVVIFFDDKAELENLKAKADEAMEVPFGCYQVNETMQGYMLSPVATKSTERPILDKALLNNLLTDTDTFFANRDFYQANGLTHKRGVLIFGHPGVGKTTFIKHYLGQLRGQYGVIVDCSRIYFGAGLFHYLKAVFGNRPKVLVMEDVDGATNDYGSRSAFLNFIDGPRELDNTLIVATTNYPERLDSAILDRPSRFDAIYYCGLPGPELRKEFLLKWFPDLGANNERMQALVLATDGFSGAYFKELFTLTGLRQCSVEDALKALQDRRKMIEQFGRISMPKWGKELLAPMAMAELPEAKEAAVEASAFGDYRVDEAFARKIMACSRTR